MFLGDKEHRCELGLSKTLKAFHVNSFLVTGSWAVFTLERCGQRLWPMTVPFCCETHVYYHMQLLLIRHSLFIQNPVLLQPSDPVGGISLWTLC